MKTLSLTVGLLLVLFTVYHSDASKAVISPDLCCFHFFDKRIPKENIVSIVKTHSQCSTPAFVIKTPRRLFCVKQTAEWAMEQFVKQEREYVPPVPQKTTHSLVYMKQFSSADLPSCPNPEWSHHESKLNNNKGSTVTEEHQDKVMLVCCVC
ncbi:C-C motif chemokine 3-like [Oreochromis aureus]|uniref:C-C motif chemokine 3-like n=1 Tax=Oreochromis aureus TaxID=47969 RepID=UPI00195445F0|nr:C-C motif chemokine 3-like [Oreochromis aureus]